MSTYYSGSGLTYLQYLQTKSFVSDVKGAQQKAAKAINLTVAKQTRELIASQEALARDNIRSMEAGFGRVAEATEEGFEHLSWEIRDVSRNVADVSHGISQLNATFQWGLSEMLSQMTRMNSAVSELVKLASTPVQTEANEYFQNARDGLRRGLYPEALEEVEKAIAKHRFEWRYYSLAGTIRLGSVSGGLELFDLGKAEEYFLLAARYAKSDSPLDAACSYLAASWAAYCQKKMGPALTHVEAALELDPQLTEALFQAGKLYMALREPDSALPLLGKAIELDKGYALKAAADGDFQRYDAELRQFLEALRDAKAEQIRSALEATFTRFDFWLSRSKEALEDPLVARARTFMESAGMPLWDLLVAWEDLSKLPGVISERASKVRLIVRTELPGPEYEFEVKGGAGKSQSLNLGGRLLGARFSASEEQYRLVKKTGKKECVAIYDATGEVSQRIDLAMVPSGHFTKKSSQRLGGMYASMLYETQSVTRVTRPLLVSRTLITKEQFQAFVPSGKADVGQGRLPVINVSWHDALAYCNALSREVGLEETYIISPRGVKWKGADCIGYRLLTNAEWEYACFGSSSAEVSSWNDDQVDKAAWVKENSEGVIHPVALKQPNQWGLYDLLGLVSEWVFDWYISTPWSAPEEDPVIPAGSDRDTQILGSQAAQVDSIERVTRGGSYMDPDQHIRSCVPARGSDPKKGSPTIGFRIARTVSL
jgi:formylglycine-generating enzyme required for sulfatase activity/tetratricopeptide (TPR) repeat protein